MTQGVAGFQGALGQLAIEAGNSAKQLVARIGNLSPAEGYKFITDAYPEVIEPFISASGEMTAQWYHENQPRVVRRAAKIFTPEPAQIPDRSQTSASARWALSGSGNVSERLRGTSTRYVFDESRRTVRDNAQREGVKYTRHAASNACGFCKMLATRVLTQDEPGAPGLYVSKLTARRNAHKFDDVRGHDHCKCLVVAVRAGYEPPAYVHDWVDDYYAVSRDDDGALLPEWNIAYRMEQRAAERAGGGAKKARAGKAAAEEVINLDEAAKRDAAGQFIGNRKLYQRNSARAAEIAKSARDQVAAAQRITSRVDSYTATASKVTGNVKRATDFADKTIGGFVPVVRDVKRAVDAADKATSSAAKLTGTVNRTVTSVDTAIRDTERIAHAAKELVTDVTSVIDDAAYITAGVKQLLADAGDLTDIAAAAGLRDKALASVVKANDLTGRGLELIDRADRAATAMRNYPGKIADIPNVLRAPLIDAQKFVKLAQATPAAAHQAAVDALDMADALRALVDNVIDYRRNGFMPNYNRTAAWSYSERVTDELGAIIGGRIPAPKPIGSVTPPTWVRSERLELPAPPRRLELTAAPPVSPPKVDQAEIDALVAPPAAVKPPKAPKPPVRTLDEVEAEFNAALASGADDATIDRLAGEMLEVEAAEAKRAANRAKAAARREAAGNAKYERMSQLIEDGLDPIEAEAKAFGISEATVRSRTILSEARSNGYQVSSVEDLVKQVFMEKASEAYFAASEATNGYMLKRKYEGRIDPTDLWYCTDKQARAWISDEMAAWFDANGRITRAAVRGMILDGDQVWRNPMTEDFLQ